MTIYEESLFLNIWVASVLRNMVPQQPWTKLPSYQV